MFPQTCKECRKKREDPVRVGVGVANLVPRAFSMNEVVGALPSQSLSAIILSYNSRISFFPQCFFSLNIPVTYWLRLFKAIKESPSHPI